MAGVPIPTKPEKEQKFIDGEEVWGTQYMGPPAAPSAHPNNQQAAIWGTYHNQQQPHQPYVLQYQPVGRASSSPMGSILDVFNEWTGKAEILANNVWQNCKFLTILHFYPLC